jgi:hypothetical protein
MAEHRAVTEARAAYARGDRVLQVGLTLVGGTIQDRRSTTTATADDVNAVLNEIVNVGWDLVTAHMDRQPRNPEILMGFYLFRRR